jgi:hypothetical protein
VLRMLMTPITSPRARAARRGSCACRCGAAARPPRDSRHARSPPGRLDVDRARSRTARPVCVPRVSGRAALTDWTGPKCARRPACLPSDVMIRASLRRKPRSRFSATARTRLHVRGETRDDLQDLRRRRLRSSASFVSLNRRTFSIAITAWSAKVLQQVASGAR